MLTFVHTNALSASTLAAERARGNIERNRLALSESQPDIALPQLANIAEFLLGRDGSLTAKDTANRWISGCSLPMRAAQEILRKLDVTGVVGCLLAPTHAAQIRVALDKLAQSQALVVIVPSLDDLTQFLHCEDFSHDLICNRLWFAAGDNWKDGLSQIFAQHPGLPTPTQFLRLPVTSPELNETIITESQPVFAAAAKARSEAAKQICWSPRRDASKRTLAIVAPSHFRLWNDRGEALAHLFDTDPANDLEIIHIDPDDPASACPSDLPRRLQHYDAVITADITRADLPNLLSLDMPWITWLTTPRVPSIESAGLRDHLIVPDPAAALNAGWPSHRVHRGTWPTVVSGSTNESPQALAIIADTHSLDTPEDLNNFSSQRVLWDTLRAEISNNPFVALPSPQEYLLARLKQVGFIVDTFPVVRFLTQLIYPAIAQSIASVLTAAKVPLKLYGTGWDALPQFEALSSGHVSNREQFEAIVRQPIALIDIWPGVIAHPINAVGRPVLHLTSNGREQFIRAAQAILSHSSSVKPSCIPTLSLSLFREILSAATA